ncbi:autotransporter outer membrane beta-barrel domain-containing protein [Pseudochelatococcus contaminans]|uniref:Autotransporter domain-containing protein n=1 Tax=Pseudochelatococcus contaminans TaxID=1538103 RepID=A0A7W5Z1A3_9HYPH|nr:autotransporter outer membrane beta-barrel domain-containing protein [Pseudochelatococcus contaminans]MBB3808182.1 hypothetical protein [Pseudochelatococcus contaminans]
MSVAFSTNKRSVAKGFLAGISTLSLAIGMAHIAAPAGAQTSSSTDETYTSLKTSLGYDGQAAANLLLDNNHYSNLDVVNDRGIVMWSFGGRGVTTSDSNGTYAGSGGTVTLTQYGNLSGHRAANAAYAELTIKTDNGNLSQSLGQGGWTDEGDYRLRFESVRNANTIPLIFLYSQGGQGGEAYGADKGRGKGGHGNDVTFDLHSAVTTTGDRYPGVWISSSGGNTGWGVSSQALVNDFIKDPPNGGDVSATVSAGALISTNGTNSPGLIADSVGATGGGIKQGVTNSWYQVPNHGGSGGRSKGVAVSNAGTIKTSGSESPAIIAQSIGGTGTQQQNNLIAAAGGNGGLGMPVAVDNFGMIDTSGLNSFGIAAYSIGGLGGSGASGLGKGADAGSNGSAGTVAVTNKAGGSIVTRGEGAFAILAQSFGGGLNAGYYNPFADQTSGHGGNGTHAGGSGSHGGAAGSVTVTNAGSIETQGSDAAAVLAQSLGGMGGQGGNATSEGLFVAVALGGDGGPGGAASSVNVSNTAGQIVTHGDSAAAVFAQSIGGGGGAGGVAKAHSVGIVTSISVAIGGAGGSGSTGGTVDITNNAMISTSGENSSGIYAQSIGGGGGHAGSASAASAAFGAGDFPSVDVSVGIGGSGGSGATGGDVNITNTGSIRTLGTSSHGISGQSIGGGGGDGGGATSFVFSASQYAFGIPVAVGASGGQAGHASKVSITNSRGTITTSGNGAYGIYGQSVGGGGGSGGSSTALADIYKIEGIGAAINVSIGGKGGGGGNGSTVTVQNDTGGTITTVGVFAHGIFVQSVGGGGGNGGSADSSAGTGIIFGDTISKWLSESKIGEIPAIQVTLGGSGGSGGHGGEVTVTNTGLHSTIRTQGSNSHGIFAQSIGGGGGNSGNYANAAEGRLTFTVGVGATGGSGGTGGLVKVTNETGAVIATEQDGSHGIFAQSIGGGGGNGGSLTAEKEMFPDIGGKFIAKVKQIIGYDYVMQWAVKHGYKDDYDIIKGLVDVVQSTGVADNFEKEFKEKLLSGLKGSELTKDYEKSKDKAIKDGDIDAEGKKKEPEAKYPSLSLTVGVGGQGGVAGSSDGVTVTNDGTISTAGNASYGVFAQSIGGGGGVGGLGGSLNGNGNQVNLNLGVGGKGGHGSIGGAVDITNSGTVTTLRDASYGIFGQSIGGGGGVGGGSSSSTSKKITANLNIGGNGGSGNNGGTVTITNSGSVQTSGIESHALVAQSIGGGGGAAVLNLGDDSDATESEVEKIKERLEVTDKIATILGAAGTKLLKAESAEEHIKELKKKALEEAHVTLDIGGTGGAGGNGDSATVNHSGGSITTSGEAAFGIMAQSIGGGGGLSSTTGKASIIKDHTFTIGGKGGSSGNGGEVILNLAKQSNAYITTSGDGAHAVLAQSIGGGGGYLGRVDKSHDFVSSEHASGNGGHVSIQMGNANNYAYINTTGKGAHGIFAQSIGGGGGTWTNVDDYYTLQPGRSGVLARPNASGNGGNIDINYNGSIHATGHYAYAILAQSGKQTDYGTIDPNSTGGRIHITLDGGNFVGGWGDPGRDLTSAIRIDGGGKGSDDNNMNIITIGAGANVSAASGVAILAYAGGSEFVKLYGKLSGDVILTDNPTSTTEVNYFHVESNGNQSGYYTSRAGTGTVSVGNGAFIIFGGTLDVGGINNISTLNVGSMDVRSGTLLVDVNATTAGVISHDAINVGGQLYLQLNGPSSNPYVLKTQIVPNVMTGLLKRDYWIFSKPVDGRMYVDVAANPGSPITWTSTYSGQSITPKADFVGSATSQGIPLTTAQRTMLTNLQTVWDDPKQTSLANLFGIAAREIHSTAQYAEAINRLDPSQYSSTAAAETNGAKVSLKTPLSCPVFIDAGVTLGETQCVWGRISGAFAKNKSSHGYKQDEFSYRVGAQWEIAPDWFLGVSGSYFSSELDSHSGHLTSRGKGGNVAAALKRQMGPWLFAVSGHFGYGSYDTSHNIKVGNQNWFSEGNSDVWTGALGFRASYELALGNFYIRPAVDLDVVHTYVPSFVSQGNFPYAYHFGAMKEWTLSASPFVEVGTRIDISEKTWLRPFASIGGTFLHDGDLDRKVSFGHEAPRFTATHAMDQHYLDLGAGLQLFSNDQLELRAEYKAKIGENYTRHEASGRMSIKF